MNYRGKKMQTGGAAPRQQDYPDYESWQVAMDNWVAAQSMLPSNYFENLYQNQPIDEATIDRPAPDPMSPQQPMNRIQEGIQRGIIEGPQGRDPQEYYNSVNTPEPPKQKKDIFQTLQNVGLGLRGARTGLSWLSGIVERGRQNQYDYKQQTALGQMNPMQVSDFQPNPYSLYAKYGGNLKTFMKEYDKWTNDAQYDFGSGDNDKGKMQQGGLPDARKNYYDALAAMPAQKATPTYPSQMFYQNRPLTGSDSAYFRNYFNDAVANPTWATEEAGRIDASQANYMVKRDPKDYDKNLLDFMNLKSTALTQGSERKPPVNLVPYLPAIPQSKKPMKKGGYEIDRMLIVRKILPELLHFGRLGTSKYRKMQVGGALAEAGQKALNTPAPGIVDYLKKNGLSSSLESRKFLFDELFKEPYTGTAAQNTKIMKDIKNKKYGIGDFVAAMADAEREYYSVPTGNEL